MTFTGDAKYGDWIERLVYNGIGASLPIRENGENFYYADYRIGGGTKTYARSTYTCCSGTYIQAVTEYANMVYFKDPSTLYVNLYLPSEVTWKRPEGEVKVLQETSFPEADTITFTVSTSAPSKFALKFRVPEWAQGMSASVNGEASDFKTAPGTWSGIEREWKNGDKVTLKIPLSFRYQAVDKWTPNRVAVLRGPVVMVMDATVHEPSYAVPETEEELNKVLRASGAGQRDTGLPPPPQSQFAMQLTGKNAGDETASGANTGGVGRRGAAANAVPATAVAGARFMPFYAVDEVNAYRMYFDKDAKPLYLW